MPGYIFNVCARYKHLMPAKCQLSPHKYCKIIFGQTTQLTHIDPDSPSLSSEGAKKIQGIIGTLLYYARAVDNKLLAIFSALSSQPATATEATNVTMNQLLDYLATYPDNSTTYFASIMILCAHAFAGFYNESKGRSQAGAHFFVSENHPFPKHNGLVFSISQIMKFVMSSAAKAKTKLGAHYTTTKEIVLLCQTLIKIGWPQPRMPKQTTPLPLASPTSPFSHERPGPWTLTYGGSAAENLNNSSVTTGIEVATIGQTTTPNTTHPSTMRSTDPSMPVKQAYYLELLPQSGPATFSY
jgi:hypothetical protein